MLWGFELLLLFSSFGFIGPYKNLYIFFDFLLVNRLTANERAYKLMSRKYFDEFSLLLCLTRKADVSNNLPHTLQKKKKKQTKNKKTKKNKIKRTDGWENSTHGTRKMQRRAKLFIC